MAVDIAMLPFFRNLSGFGVTSQSLYPRGHRLTV